LTDAVSDAVNLEMRHFYLLVSVMLLSAQVGWSQGCDNADFSANSFVNWTGRTGSCCGINTPAAGIVNGRHTIMTGTGTDPIACDQITEVAPGYTTSARLGNSGVGAEAERLSYTYLVTPQNALFIYNYAVVMEDPGHTDADQPRFEIRVLNGNGQLISPQCGFYQVTAAANIEGFRSCGGVRYRAWTPVGIDLTGSIGQNVTIEFSTGDCALGGHFGYAYIVGECSPLEIQVDYCPSNSDQAILTAPKGFDYLWSTGQTTQQISITDPPNGSIYSCTLTAVTGCQVTLNATITSTAVNTEFSFPPPCPGVPVQFTDLSTSNIGSVVSWDWNFGDGTTSTDQNPVHTYPLSGIYNASLTAMTDAGCMATYSATVNVNPYPQAGLSAPPVCHQTPTQFINTTLFPPTIGSWSWDFGDGSPLNTTDWNPQHTYAAPGNYTAQLITYSQNGVCTDTATTTTSVAPLPTPDFDFEDVCFGNTVEFTNTSIGNITNTRWNFGDNSPPSFFTSTTHDYIAPGVYDVTMRIISQEGCIDSLTQELTVSPSPISDFSFESVCQGEPVTFTNTSSIPPAGNVIGSWVWDFGDGSAVNTTDWEPQHNYQSSGTFDVTLITRSLDQVCTDTLVDSVRIYPLPIVDFSFENVCFGQPVEFVNLSTGEISSWKWEFGDQTPPNFNANISHTYPAPGTYTVQQTVTTIYGCTDALEQDVVIYPSPTLGFTYNEVCEGDTTQLTTTASVPAPGAIVSYGWDLADGSPPVAGPSVEHLYGFAGNFNVKHFVITTEGCVDSVVQTVTVNPNPVVDFAGEPTEGCSPLCVDFYELSGIQSGFNEYFTWDFGDGSAIAQQITGHCYINSTTNVVDRWPVTLTVTSNKGCTSTLTKNNYITNYPIPISRFDLTPRATSILFPTIRFSDLSVDAVQWLWSFGDLQVNNTSTAQNPAYTYLDSGTYVITQVAFNEHGCTDTSEVTMVVTPAFTVYIPNAFTPDANGVNDRFMVEGTGIIGFVMYVFDRWGEEVYYSEDIEEGWGGDVRGGGDVAKQDSYVYKIQVRDLFNRTHDFHGRVMLMK
jgi:gliding motility-associated-like protein